MKINCSFPWFSLNYIPGPAENTTQQFSSAAYPVSLKCPVHIVCFMMRCSFLICITEILLVFANMQFNCIIELSFWGLGHINRLIHLYRAFAVGQNLNCLHKLSQDLQILSEYTDQALKAGIHVALGLRNFGQVRY